MRVSTSDRGGKKIRSWGHDCKGSMRKTVKTAETGGSARGLMRLPVFSGSREGERRRSVENGVGKGRKKKREIISNGDNEKAKAG